MTNCVWSSPPKHLVLPTDEVHVFCSSLNQPDWYIQHLLLTLSPDELQRADRFHFEVDRNRFIVGRGLLRSLLGNYLGISPSRVEFRYSDRGKPFLATQNSGETLNFNVSHSEELALYAIAPGRSIGIDIEHIRPLPDAQAIALRFFSPTEKAVFSTLSAEHQLIAFFNCWTRKEAYLKAIGDGLAFPLDQFDVSLAPGTPAKLLSIVGDTQAAENWSLFELKPAPNYTATLAVEANNWRIQYWQWGGLNGVTKALESLQQS